MNEGWELESAVAHHEAHPDTFWIPSEKERASLGPGRGAKLLFVLPEGVERMWVAIGEALEAFAGGDDAWAADLAGLQ